MAHVANVTIQSSKVAADATDFVVYVDLSDLPSDFWDTVANGGGDIRCYKSDGTTELAREVVSCNTTGDTGELHIKYTGTLSGSSNTTIQIHADGTSSDYAVTATYGRNNVWTNYVAVLHGDALTDSTGTHTVTQSGTVAYGTGQMGNGFDMPGNGTNYPRIGDASTLDLLTDHYMSFWGKETSTSGRRSPYTKGSPWTGGNGYWLHVTRPSTWTMNDPGTAYSNLNIATEDIGTTAMNHIVYRKKAAYSMQMFFNGTAESEITATENSKADDAYTATTADVWVGRRGDAADAWDGIIDEFRLSDSVSALDSDWIATEDNNQGDTSTFYTASAPGGGAYSQAIIIV